MCLSLFEIRPTLESWIKLKYKTCVYGRVKEKKGFFSLGVVISSLEKLDHQVNNLGNPNWA